MSDAPVDVLREQFAATNERDFPRAMSFYADDVVLVVEEGFLSTGTFEAPISLDFCFYGFLIAELFRNFFHSRY